MMRYLSLLLFIALALSAKSYAASVEREILQSTLLSYIQPSYGLLVERTQALELSAAELCSAPDASRLQASREQFHQVVDAWGRIEWLRIGPVMRENRLERVFYFPDRKSIGLRQVQSAVATENPEVLALSILQNLSVAMQGLGALDYLLFGRDSETLTTGNTFRCQYARTVAENLQHIAGVIDSAWSNDDQLIEDFLKPSSTNPNYLSDKEAMNTLVGTIIHGLQGIRDARIGVFLRAPKAKDRPKSAPLWRSQSTTVLLAANLQGLEQLFIQSQISQLLPAQTNGIESSLLFDFRQSINTAQTLDSPIADILANPEQRERMSYLNLAIGFVIDRLNNEFSPATGLSTGFSFNDGD